MLEELEADNLQEVLSANDKVMVQYGATWCGNCRLMKPKLKRMARENEGVMYVYVDAEKFPESRKFADVTNLPTFAAFQKGTIVNQVTTSKEEALKSLNDEITHL